MVRKLRNIAAGLALTGAALFQVDGCSFVRDELVGLNTEYALTSLPTAGSSDRITKQVHPGSLLLQAAGQ